MYIKAFCQEFETVQDGLRHVAFSNSWEHMYAFYSVLEFCR